MATKYPDSKAAFLRYGILFTDEQLERLAAKHPVTKRDLKDDALSDTFPREIMLDILVEELFGQRKLKLNGGDRARWPGFGDSDEYKAWFGTRFPKKAEAKGFRLSKRVWK